MRKSQVAFEFMVVLFLVILITMVFGTVAADRLGELKDEQLKVQMQDVALTVKNEIDIAHSMVSGYSRTFVLPYYLGNEYYTVEIENNFVVVTSKGRELVMAIQPLNGTLRQGINFIAKTGDTVFMIDSSAAVCENAQTDDLCSGLDVVFGTGYEAACCSEHGFCC